MFRRVDIIAYRMMNIGDILQRAKSHNEGALERAENKSFWFIASRPEFDSFSAFFAFLGGI